MRALMVGWVLVVGLQWIASGAAAEPTERQKQQDARWVPGASLFIVGQPGKQSAVASSDTQGVHDGETTSFSWAVAVSAELATPVVEAIPGRPRFYAHGDVGYTFDKEDPVVTSGSPGGPPRVRGGSPSVASIQNVGTSVRVEAKPLVLSGGAGAIFGFEAWERNFRVRPSLEWTYWQQTIKGELGGGENAAPGSPPDSGTCGPCQTVYIQTQTQKGYHSLGPGLEIEVDAARAGDFLVSFYALGRAYRTISDRGASMQKTSTWRLQGGATSTRPPTTFTVKDRVDPWRYRFGFGLRLLWLPD